MKVVLYYAPVACAMVPYITLTEAKADFEVHPVNMRKRDHFAPDYLKMNPEHKVPVLTVDGKPLTQNVAIAQWIHRTYPQAKVLPTDPWQELQAISILAWCASGIHPHLGRINNPLNFCDTPGSEQGTIKMAVEKVAENFEMAEAMLKGKDYFFGSDFTAPDAHFFWCFRRAIQLKVDVAPYKNCQAHHERMKTRASVKKLLAYEQEIQAEFAKAA
jgi:glutathione S-transferase